MKLFESKQKPLVVYNPADILFKYNMKPGDFVSIAYIADVLQGQSSNPIRTGRMYNINSETDIQLEQYIDELPDNNIKRLLTEFRESKKYQDLLNGIGKNKTGKVDLSTEHIIKVSHLTCNWKDSKGLAKFYQKQQQDELQLRHDYGFEDGFEDDVDEPYDDENWRDKYNGRNILLRTKKNFNGNVYKDATIIPGIYASLSDPSKVAIRFAYNPRSSHKESDYYYVNSDGTLFSLNRAFVTFLTYAYKQQKAEDNTPILPEEKEFIIKLKEILKESPSIAELTMKCDQILFLKSTAREQGDVNSKIPFVWINSKTVVNTYDYIDVNDLNKIIKSLVYSIDDADLNGTIENINIKGKSISDLLNVNSDGRQTADPNEVRKKLGITEALHYLVEKYNRRNKMSRQYKVLYETIMRDVAKTVKKRLDENLNNQEGKEKYELFTEVKKLLDTTLKIQDLYATYKQIINDGQFDDPNYVLPKECIDKEGYEKLISFLQDENNRELFKKYYGYETRGHLKDAIQIIKDNDMEDASDECLRNQEVINTDSPIVNPINVRK